LHQELLTKSPYLSDTVIQSAIAKEDVLPNPMIRDILVANPHSAKSSELMNQLDERFIPMPDPLMEEILAGESILSAKEELESEITIHAFKRKQAFYQLLREYQNDSILQNAQDSVIWLLQEKQSLESAYLLAFDYLKNGDTANVTNTLNSIPNNYTFSDTREEVYNDYQEYFGILSLLKSQNKSVLELNSGQLAVIQNLTNTGHEPVRSYSRNILLANQLTGYSEPILLPDPISTDPSRSVEKSDLTIPEGYFRLFPNPAKHYVIIEYNLKNDFAGSSAKSFVVYNVCGKKIDYRSIHKPQDQMILSTENYPSGVYFCCLSMNGNVVQSIRFTVLK